MIARITGVLVSKDAARAVIDVGGVGYSIHIPLTTFYELPGEGETVVLYTHTHVRQDDMALFGFLREKDRDLFRIVISVSGFGPRLALGVLSGISSENLCVAIREGDVKKLLNVPGVGRKMAERLIFEMKEKIGKISFGDGVDGLRREEEAGEVIRREALSALVNLGYRAAVAEKAIDKACQDSDSAVSLDLLLKKTLRILAG